MNNKQYIKNTCVKDFKAILYQANQSVDINKKLHSTGTSETTPHKPAGKKNCITGLDTASRKFTITPEDKFYNKLELIRLTRANNSTIKGTKIKT